MFTHQYIVSQNLINFINLLLQGVFKVPPNSRSLILLLHPGAIFISSLFLLDIKLILFHNDLIFYKFCNAELTVGNYHY